MSRKPTPKPSEPALFQPAYGGTWRPTQAATEGIGLPHDPRSATSKSAAKKMRKHAPVQREHILAYIVGQGARGATAEEVAIALGLRSQSAGPRVKELREAGEIIDTGRTRPTTSGRSAAVYVAVEDSAAQAHGRPDEGGR